MSKYTAEEQLERRITHKFRKGSGDYQLLEDGDDILIALSGGKDSLALVELMGRQAKIYKPRIRVRAIHVKMRNVPYEIDLDYLENFCAQHGVSLIVKEGEFDAETDTRKSPCFLCSWNRRKILFATALELGCNKIALGHHMDDILSTLLMNITFQGAFSSMPPRLVMRKFAMTIIRPMCLVSECDLKELAELHNYQKQKKNCPYEEHSHRSDMEGILNQLEKMNPKARYSLWNSMTNIQEDMLPQEMNVENKA